MRYIPRASMNILGTARLFGGTKEPQTGRYGVLDRSGFVVECPVEFFDYHFDGRHLDEKNWEKSVAPQCRSTLEKASKSRFTPYPSQYGFQVSESPQIGT